MVVEASASKELDPLAASSFPEFMNSRRKPASLNQDRILAHCIEMDEKIRFTAFGDGGR